jgi:hypothetical protein
VHASERSFHVPLHLSRTIRERNHGLENDALTVGFRERSSGACAMTQRCPIASEASGLVECTAMRGQQYRSHRQPDRATRNSPPFHSRMYSRGKALSSKKHQHTSLQIVMALRRARRTAGAPVRKTAASARAEPWRYSLASRLSALPPSAQWRSTPGWEEEFGDISPLQL